MKKGRLLTGVAFYTNCTLQNTYAYFHIISAIFVRLKMDGGMNYSYKHLYIVGALLLGACSTMHKSKYADIQGLEEDHVKRQAWELQQLADPSTGKIPDAARSKELAFATTIENQTKDKTGLESDLWNNIGPWNVGGRTRCIAIDIADEHTLIAAGASGGIWKSKDDGKNWERKTTPDQLPNITCLIQNKKTGATNIWYAGTGEAYGGSVSDGGSFYLGDGVYKSIDNGETWQPIKRTTSGTPQSFSKVWQLVWNMALNTYDTNYTLFAATYGSIMKSTKGDSTFQTVRSGNGPSGNPSYATDVAVTSAGIVYATLSSEGGSPGIWRSADNGKTWKNILPTTFPKEYQRIVIGINPQNENQIYFLAHTISEGFRSENFRGDVEWNALWVYKYLSGDGTGNGGYWEDRSQNLPDKGGQFGKFITQQGYDMYIKVKPDDSNVVFIGVTNIWRSTDAFKTNTKIDWCGGYGVNTTLPDFKVYTNHHPDNHNLVFYPSNPKKMISASDGGVHLCDDNLASSITWKSLNNGYLTTQLYTVAMDHSVSGNTIIAGFQDNGVYWNTQTDVNNRSNWVMPFNGDGSFVYVPVGAPELFVSKQEGSIYKIKVDQNGQTTQWVRVDPAYVNKKSYQFINPFVIDPNNEQRMYLPAGKQVWRNNDLSKYIYINQLDSVKANTGWDSLVNTYDSNQIISAVAISTQPADILFYGTTDGKLYKVANAATGQPSITEITGSNFPKKSGNTGPNINCIYPDPENADILIVVFTNYNIESVFYSSNGGVSWTPISGNLEQFAGGSGNGPSCRWVSSIKVADGSKAYFMATTTGLYSTDTLKGNSTVWVHQAPETIGNYPCAMIDTRSSDGKVLVATHGSGLFEAKFTHRYQVLPTNKFENSYLDLFPNPASESVAIETGTAPQGMIKMELSDIYGRNIWVRSITNGSQISVNREGLPAGVYYIRLSTGIWSKSATLVWK
jgi:hypothetical protein